MNKLIASIILLASLCSCNNDNARGESVELRFTNSTGMFVDSVFFNVNEDNIRYKVESLEEGETTDYVQFTYSYTPPLATIHTDGLIISHPRTDLVCCFVEGKYTIEFEIFLDNNNEEKSRISNVIMDE